MNELDDIDRVILMILQQGGRIAAAELARRVHLSPPAVHARLHRLEEQGFIRAYVALLDLPRVGYDMLCFVHVTLQAHTSESVAAFRAAVRSMPEVLECHHVTGEFDYLLKVIIRNREDLERFVVQRLTPVPGLARIHTSLALSEVKSTTQVPLA
jgi:DNA-binding Lrp family transcriptional regulator